MTWCHYVDTVQSGTGEENGEKVALEARPEDTNRRCRSDVIWQAVPASRGSRKVADGRQSSAADDQR